jgi:predicted ATPase
LVDDEYGRDSFEIGLRIDDLTRVCWQFQSDHKDSPTAPLVKLTVTMAGGLTRSRPTGESGDSLPSEGRFIPKNKADPVQGRALDELNEALSHLIYLSTDRIGPRETYDAADNLSDRVELGSGGELTPWFLFQYGERPVHPSLCLDATSTLARQAEAWLADLFPGAGLDLKSVEGTNLVTLRLRTNPAGRLHRPQNVGYGLTHVLPVLTAALGARRGQIVIVENPEAHLHPAAQAKMGRLLALAAATGVQVLLETHSDHVLNGVRRAVKERVLPPDQVALHFFQHRSPAPDAPPQVISPVLNEQAVVDHWPAGFFDQFDRDLEALADWN